MAGLAYVLFAATIARAQVPAPQHGTPVHNIQLTDTHEIADAVAVSLAISVMVEDATSCGAAQDRQSCVCGFKDDLKSLEAAYNTAVAKHPDWNADDSVVAFVDTGDGKSVTINFPGVKRQLDACAQR